MSEKKDRSSLVEKYLVRVFSSFPSGSDDWRVSIQLYLRMLCLFTFGPMIHTALLTTDMNEMIVHVISALAVVGSIRVTLVIWRLIVAIVDRIMKLVSASSRTTA